MDLPRPVPASRRWRRLALALVVVAAAVALRAPTRVGAMRALEILGSLGAVALLAGNDAYAGLEPTPRQEAGAAPASSGAAAAKAAQAGAAFPDGAAVGPRYDGEGRLLVPDSYHEWVFVGAAAGLSYSEEAVVPEHQGPGMFTHVYVEPSAYRHYRDTGEFPDGTQFVLEIHRPESNTSIARQGWFEGARVGVHASVKDTARFAEGWAYFIVEAGRGRQVRTASCFACHQQHGAVDNVFVQFYPVLRELADSR